MPPLQSNALDQGLFPPSAETDRRNSAAPARPCQEAWRDDCAPRAIPICEEADTDLPPTPMATMLVRALGAESWSTLAPFLSLPIPRRARPRPPGAGSQRPPKQRGRCMRLLEIAIRARQEVQEAHRVDVLSDDVQAIRRQDALVIPQHVVVYREAREILQLLLQSTLVFAKWIPCC